MNVFSGPGKETGKGRKYCRERGGSPVTGLEQEQQGGGHAEEWKTLEQKISLPERGVCRKGSGQESGSQEGSVAVSRGLTGHVGQRWSRGGAESHSGV